MGERIDDYNYRFLLRSILDRKASSFLISDFEKEVHSILDKKFGKSNRKRLMVKIIKIIKDKVINPYKSEPKSEYAKGYCHAVSDTLDILKKMEGK